MCCIPTQSHGKFFPLISRLKIKLECLSEEFVSANEIKLCHNTKDHNISL
jgi:hypothetical protein